MRLRSEFEADQQRLVQARAAARIATENSIAENQDQIQNSHQEEVATGGAEIAGSTQTLEPHPTTPLEDDIPPEPVEAESQVSPASSPSID